MSSFLAKHALKRIDRSDIAAAPEGERVRIVGTVSAPAPLVSSNRRLPCVYFHARYEEQQHKGGKGSSRWTAADEETKSCDFLVEDGTGIAFVDATSLVAILESEAYETVAVVADVLRGREAIVAIGQRVTVAGLARYEIVGDGADDYREAKRRLVIVGDERSPVVVTTDPALVADED